MTTTIVMTLVVKTKFRNIRTVIDGFSFPSKKEANRYATLKTLRKSGLVSAFLFSANPEDKDKLTYKFACGVKYILDFVVMWNDKTITYEDVKGIRTPVYKIKKKLMLHEFNIDITEI